MGRVGLAPFRIELVEIELPTARVELVEVAVLDLLIWTEADIGP
jgi:hypothetical protein